MPIPSGTIIWEFTEGVDWELTPEELEAFPQPFRERIEHFCYLDERGLFVLCGDNARFMNHSFSPNCDDVGDYTIARADIAAWEELTCDYRKFDVPSMKSGLPEFRAEQAAEEMVGR